MKELKLFTFASDTKNPIDIVKSLKGKSNLILAIKLADLSIAKFRNKFIVVKSNIDDFKDWDILDEDYQDKLKDYQIIEVINTSEYDSEISKIDANVRNIVKKGNKKIIPLFSMPHVISFQKTGLNNNGILRYLDSMNLILNLVEEGNLNIEFIISIANKQKFMSNVNKYQYINSSGHSSQITSKISLDYDKLVKDEIDMIFGNPLIGFGITKNKDIELIYLTLDRERKGEFDTHPLMRLLNNNFYKAKPI